MLGAADEVGETLFELHGFGEILRQLGEEAAEFHHDEIAATVAVDFRNNQVELVAPVSTRKTASYDRPLFPNAVTLGISMGNSAHPTRLRTVAISRRNWMFAGSDAGAERAAVIYSPVATCRPCPIDPFAYLRGVLDRVSVYPARRIADLTPSGWGDASPDI